MKSTMLSRVADNLYWMSRYLERAEHTARVVDVTLDLMPDRSIEDNRRAWARTYEGLRLTAPDLEPLDAYQMTQELTFGSSNSISAYVTAARDNARQIREHISSEMWEQTNRLYLNVRQMTMQQLWRDQPHLFFQGIKEGTHLFQGITDSTMYHGEGWYFIQFGMFIERAGNVAGLLKAYLQDRPNQMGEAVSSRQYVDWVSLLRSCTAFEAYCKVHTAETRLDSIADFLLLTPEFPHSVLFAVSRMQQALRDIAIDTGTALDAPVNRQVGRLKAALDYDSIHEVMSQDLGKYLDRVQTQCASIHDIAHETYIDYPVDRVLAA